MDKIAVLIPCYNEEMTIAKVVSDAKKYLPEATIYVYDNNSTDKTAEEAKKAGAIVRKEVRQGKGNVIRTMFRDIDAEVYLMVDGDDTYGLESAPEMVRRVKEDNVDMVIGDRLSGAYYEENKRAFHSFGNDLVRFQVNLLFHTNIKDIMTGLRAFSYRFVKTFPVRSKGFEIETEMTAHAADRNMLTSTLTINYRDRPEGSYSKLNTFRDGFKVLVTIGDLFRKYRPMVFYGLWSLLFFGLGIGFLIPVIMEYFATNEVARFPTLIVCCFSLLIGILCLFSGFLFSTLRSQDSSQFERALIAAEDAYKSKKNQ